jgi:hypothetical protein
MEKDLEKGQTSRGDFSIGTESFNGVRKKTLEGNSTLQRCGLDAIWWSKLWLGCGGTVGQS